MTLSRVAGVSSVGTTAIPQKDDGEHIRSIVLGVLSPGEIFLDTDGGSGSFIGCMNTGRVCFMVLASPEECDSVLEKVEQFTGRKAEKA